MIQKIFSLIIGILILLINVQQVSAHVLQTDGSIGAILHITPDDDPVAGQESEFYFEFKDRQNKFTPDQCDCIVSVSQSGNEVYTSKLFENNTSQNLTNASFSYTFPQKDIYNITVVGKPLNEKAFQSFALSYDIRVARDSQTTPSANTNNSNLIVYLVVGVIALLFAVLFIVKKYTRGGDNKK